MGDCGSLNLLTVQRRPIMIVHLSAIQDNFRALRRHSRTCAPVVKGDAYGHGLEASVIALAEAGADTFFVAHYEEALAVRRLLPRVVIGVLHGLEGANPQEVALNAISPVINTFTDLAAWQSTDDSHVQASCYIQIDTGMNRLGFGRRDLRRLASSLRSQPLNIVGYLSHFAKSDEGDIDACERQLAAFLRAASKLPPAPLSIANSAGIALGCGVALDFTRPGKSVFGIGNRFASKISLQRTARVVAPVVQVRQVGRGEAVGYGSSWIAKRQSILATVGIGYSDGLQRALGNRGALVFRGREAPVVGRVSMDLITVDLSDFGDAAPSEGDWMDVTDEAGFASLAAAGGTIEHEIVIMLGKCCHKVYD